MMTRASISKASLALIACMAATAAAAQTRPYSPSLSCRQLTDIVAAEGGVVISTSQTTYDRFVYSGQFCYPTQVTEPAWIPSADDRRCFVGYTCKEADRERSR